MVDVNPYLEHSLYVGTVVILILCGLGLPIPEELTFLAAGLIGAAHGACVWLLCGCGVLGIMAGDSLTFLLGRKIGANLLRHKYLSRLLSEKNLERARSFFRRRGSKTIFIARFVAGIRAPTFFVAGGMGVRYRTFFLWDFLGALISCPISIWVAYHFGQPALHCLSICKLYFTLAVLLILVLAVLFHYVWRRSASARTKPGGEPPSSAEFHSTMGPKEPSLPKGRETVRPARALKHSEVSEPRP